MRDAAARHTTALVRAAADGSGGPLRHAAEILGAAGFRLDEAGGALVARRREPRFALSGHVDVVPAGEGWTRAPSSGAVEDGRVHGRGATDMLGAVGCFLAVAEDSRGPLAVVLTTDEETTMAAAERLVADKRLDGIEAAVVGEPTDLEVGSCEKGVLWARITVHGRAAHASMPEKGENAVLLALKAVGKLASTRLSGGHALLGQPTLAITGIHGGVAQNVVPERCAFDLDLRFLPPRRVEDMVSMLKLSLVDVGVRHD
ncbi:MAG TPA: M20/M25/M40 family metallo-hydrolase, partial [Candidatus Thermoplasmatota archaeon]|nr:M20/M25/M40 family metallo-hydrolase [Candidatus Thermoplasmatota archaeon]